MSFTLAGLSLPVTLCSVEPLTDEQLMQFSEANKTCKIERTREGRITVMTPVGGIGGAHEIHIASALFQWAEVEGSGIAFGSNTGFNLPDGSCLSPDAAWLSLARWNALTPEQQAGYPPLCPESIIELRSRTDSRRLLETKMQLWLENGAELAWLVDPVDGNAVIYTAGEPPQLLERPDIIAGTGPAAGFHPARSPPMGWRPMIDVHPPHSAVHGWRDFFIHLATITIGLFIALTLESGVEALHHRHIVREARENIRHEIERNEAQAKEDVGYLQKKC